MYEVSIEKNTQRMKIVHNALTNQQNVLTINILITTLNADKVVPNKCSGNYE